MRISRIKTLIAAPESAYHLELSNDSSKVNCDYQGNPVAGAVYETSTILLYYGSRDAFADFNITVTSSGISAVRDGSGRVITPSAITAETATVTVTASHKTISGLTLSAIYTITKNKAGAPGEKATSYSLIPSLHVIRKNNKGTLLDTQISFIVHKRVGSELTVIDTYKKLSDNVLDIRIGTGNDSYIGDRTLGNAEIVVQTSRFWSNDTPLMIRLEDDMNANTCYDEESIGVVRQGDDGVIYYIESTARTIDADEDGVPTTPSQPITIRKMKKVGKDAAAETSDLTFKVYKVKNGAKTRFGSNPLSSSYTFTADVASGQDCIRAELTDGNTLVASLEIEVRKQGKTGPTGPQGKHYYYAGPFIAGNTYMADDTQAPFVSYTFTDNGKSVTKPYMLVASTNLVNGVKVAPRQNGYNGIWELMQDDFKYLISEAVFSEFAKLASAIFSGDWMLSQYGELQIDFQTGDYALLYSAFVTGDGEGATVDMQALASAFTDTSADDYHDWAYDDDTSVQNPSDGAWEWEYWSTHGFGMRDQEALLRVAYLCYRAVEYGYSEGDLMNAANGVGYTLFDPANLQKFFPNIGLDFKRGKAYLKDAYVRGTITTPTLRITADNSAQYAAVSQDGYGYTYTFLHVPKGFGTIQIEVILNAVSGRTRVCLPVVDESEVGAELVVINATSGPAGSPSGIALTVVSGNDNPPSAAWGDKNAWLLSGISPTGLTPSINSNTNSVGYLASFELAPQTVMRFKAVSFHADNVNTGSRGWVKIGAASMI